MKTDVPSKHDLTGNKIAGSYTIFEDIYLVAGRTYSELMKREKSELNVHCTQREFSRWNVNHRQLHVQQWYGTKCFVFRLIQLLLLFLLVLLQF